MELRFLGLNETRALSQGQDSSPITNTTGAPGSKILMYRYKTKTLRSPIRWHSYISGSQTKKEERKCRRRKKLPCIGTLMYRRV